MQHCLHSVSFRQAKSNDNISDYGVLEWFRKAEIEGEKIQVGDIDRNKF